MGASVEVAILDTTGRDGAQALPEDHQFPDGAKPEIADHIARLGVSVIEAGFPATPSDGEEVAQVAQTVGRTEYQVAVWRNGAQIGQVSRTPVIAGLSRTKPGDIEATWAAVERADRPCIHTFVSTDEAHMKAKFPGKSPEQVLDMGREAVAFARSLTTGHPRATVEFSAEAASTTDERYLERVIKAALDEGADTINVPDTVGQRDPLWMHGFYKRVIGWVMATNPNATISAHNHNDLGMAVANTNMLVFAAAQYAQEHVTTVHVQGETTICGVGERAGNADIFPVVASLFKFSPDIQVPITWEFNPGLSVSAATAVMGFAGLVVDRQSPIVGSDTNKHRSGIHSDGVIKGGHRLYTPFEPQFWGHGENAIHEGGKYQGKAGNRAAGQA